MPRSNAIFFCLCSLLLLPACREAKVTTYRVPKEAPSPSRTAAVSNADMATTAVPTVHGEGLSWTAPANWETKAPSAMRRGSYHIKGANNTSADLSITAFPGDVGGDLANINRWRGQIQLDPLIASSLPSQITILGVAGLELKYVDMANLDLEAPQRILGAIVSYEGNTWFFKLMGPDTLINAEKPGFIAFLKTIKGHIH